ncbi:MAG TPA: primosomal protein N' [Betaproteobacteria bacterium]|nr:primosomal protein N' [Betaproteobacteria bacterium]
MDGLPANATIQRQVLRALQAAGWLSPAHSREISPRAAAALRALAQRGWAEPCAEPPSVPSASPPPPVALNTEQHQAVAAILAEPAAFASWLLHGITGSGKTEVYLRLIDDTVARGGQVLVLAPEISLTPQLEDRFRRRFPQHTLVTLHSALNDGERLRAWRTARDGGAAIVLGTRLAVFTPMPRLKCIIVDEEHDSSYKQQEGLRYSARDVAVFRAKQLNIPVVLGSATPSLESYHHTITGRYRRLTLGERAVANARPPDVHLIDSRRHRPDQGLSAPLLAALGARLARGEQSLLFLNRRGYAPVLMCGACGWLSTCSRCTGRLVLHLRQQALRCHHCGHEARVPVACPDCGNTDLIAVGHGTQRIEERLAAHFPAARILRIDRDSTRRKHAMSELLARAHGGEADILVGTQMLAKGHDFGNLTLVGVLNPDGALHSADFRASERLFAQLMQVAGRAGRREARGEVLIQTAFPAHPLYVALQRHDYAAFAETLLAERELTGFPPFCHQALLRAEAHRLDTALDFLTAAAGAARRLGGAATVYDPVAAVMQRIAGKERAQLLVQSNSRRALHALLGPWVHALRSLDNRKVRWSLDVDPLEW